MNLKLTRSGILAFVKGNILIALGACLVCNAAFGRPLPAACPKILMFDGLEIHKQDNEAMAQYWGQRIGVDGFFVNNVMSDWNASLGNDENSAVYQDLKQFQDLYSRHGVTDNFIKVALYSVHDWRDPAAQSRVVENFRQAAHLARYAGLRGLALDLEPYKPTWNEDPGIPDKPERVFALGRRVGGVILSEYPDATIIVLPEILMLTCPPYEPPTCQVYALSSRFWDGLIQAHFKQLVLATENSYNSSRPDLIAVGARETYKEDIIRDGLDAETVPIALGIWPLAKSYTDKSARSTPAQFEERLGLAFQEARREGSPYVWIYGHGSAWEKDGPYGKGDVDPHFEEYVQVLHRVKESCAGSRKSQAGIRVSP